MIKTINSAATYRQKASPSRPLARLPKRPAHRGARAYREDRRPFRTCRMDTTLNLQKRQHRGFSPSTAPLHPAPQPLPPLSRPPQPLTQPVIGLAAASYIANIVSIASSTRGNGRLTRRAGLFPESQHVVDDHGVPKLPKG